MTLDRTVLITGAAGGIGRALLAAFATPGNRLVAVDQPGSGMSDVLAEFGDHHIGLECDLSDEAQVVAMFERLDAIAPRLDVLVNNAAIGPVMAPTVATDLSHFRLTIRTNYIGPFITAREAAARMQPSAAIVNTASLAGLVGNPTRNAYAASKAALISLTRSLACEWAARGIRVNAVAPGYVRTPMVAALEAEGKADLAAVRRRIPLGRLARADEIASAIAFLASDAARYATGSVLTVDGGWAAFNQPGDAYPPSDVVPDAERSRPEPVPGPRVVVITGAARGIGAATARRFVAGGDRVVLLDLEIGAAEQVAATLGEAARAIHCDVSSEVSVAAAFETIAREHGAIDVMINDAAVADPAIPASEQTGACHERTMDINLTGTFLCSRAAIPLLRPGSGVIVNFGSIAGLVPMVPRHTYGASKSAIDIFSRCLAAELGPQGLRAVTVAPGYIRTPGMEASQRAGRIDTRVIEARIPMGEMGRPEDIAEAVWFLASDAASYINGGLLAVDGGWNAFGNSGAASTPEADGQTVMSALFQPLNLAGLELANRIVVSPMCQYSAVDGVAQPWHLIHVGGLMQSGAGLVMMEATAVSARGRITHGCLGLYTDAQEAALTRLVADVRACSSARIGIQLSHAGRRGSARSIADRWKGESLPPDEGAWLTEGPSDFGYDATWACPEAMDVAALDRVIQSFAQAATRADRAGFDVLELHAAHGYLLHQFLSPITNTRTDAYGGSRENRMRLPLEAVTAVRAAWPREKPLGVRVNSTDWIPEGLQLQDAIAFAHALEAIGVDYVVMSAGNLAPGAEIPPATPGHQVNFASCIKRETGLVAMAVGLIASADLAERVVAEGRADLVAIGRAMLDDPRWGYHAAASLGVDLSYAPQYIRARPNNWLGYRLAHPGTPEIAATRQLDRPNSGGGWDRPPAQGANPEGHGETI